MLKTPRPLFTRDEKTLALIALMRPCDKGTTLAYAVLSKLIGLDVQNPTEGYRFLRSARHILCIEDHQVWEPIEGVGMHRCTDAEIMLLPARDRKRIHRAALRSSKKLHCADLTLLNHAQQEEYRASLVNASFLASMTLEKDFDRQKQSLHLGYPHHALDPDHFKDV